MSIEDRSEVILQLYRDTKVWRCGGRVLRF